MCKHSMDIPTLANMLVSPDLSLHTCAQDNSIEQHRYKMIEVLSHGCYRFSFFWVKGFLFGSKKRVSGKNVKVIARVAISLQNRLNRTIHLGQFHPSIAWIFGPITSEPHARPKTPQLTGVHFEKSFANQLTLHVKRYTPWKINLESTNRPLIERNMIF